MTEIVSSMYVHYLVDKRTFFDYIKHYYLHPINISIKKFVERYWNEE